MEVILNTGFWVGLGIVMIVAELVIPGGIVVFLGIGALIVAGALQLGLVTTWTAVLTLYFISSLVLVLLLRGIAQRYVGGDSSVANTDELVDAYGEAVAVVNDIGPGERPGRIRYRGSQWRALGDGTLIKAGRKASIVSIENITVIVEPVGSPTDED